MKTTPSLQTACIFLWACVSVSAQMMPTPEPTGTQTAPSPAKSARKGADEKRFYVKAYGVYGLFSPGGFRGQGAPPIQISRTNTTTGNTRNTTSSSNYVFENSFGIGLRVGGGVGHVVNDFINIGIDGEYLIGNNTSESYVITNESVRTTYNPFSTTTTITSRASVKSDYSYRIINLIPTVTFKAVSKAEYYIYNRLGVIIGIPTQLDYTSTSLYNYPASRNPTDFYETTISNEFEKTIGFGYQAALGVQFKISGSLRGFLEVAVSNLQLKTNSSAITKYSFRYKSGNEAEQTEEINLEELPEDQRQKKDLNLTIPVSAIGVAAGVVFRF